MDMIVMGFRGAGKSLYAVSLACALSKQYGLPILANIGVNYPGAGRLRSIEHFANATNAVVLFDEAHRNLDARQWKDNKQFTDTLLYNRKRMKHVIYTTPHVRNLDVRIRDIIPLLVVVDKIPNSNGISARWYDLERSGGLEGNLVPFRTNRVPDKSMFYPLYNTAEEAPILPSTDAEATALVAASMPQPIHEAHEYLSSLAVEPLPHDTLRAGPRAGGLVRSPAPTSEKRSTALRSSRRTPN